MHINLQSKTQTYKVSRLHKFLFPYDDKKDHFKALDGLRGLAVLLVILSHASIDKMYMLPGLDFAGMGKAGVFLFFVLSAYLLDRQIIVGFVSGRANGRFWANYFLRRFLRIYPLYIIALLVFYGSYRLGFQSPVTDVPTILRHISLQEGKGIFWSVAVEFKYYFISPLIMAFCNYVLKWDLKKVTLFILILIAISIYLHTKYNYEEINLIRYLPVFLCGTLLSIYEVILGKKTNLKIFKSKKLEYAGLLCCMLIIISIPSIYRFLFNKTDNTYFLGSSVFSFPYAVVWSIVLMAAKYGGLNILKKIFQLLPIRFLGIISFSTYLFHLLALKIVQLHTLHISHYIQFYIFILITCIIASCSYVLLERQLQKIRIKY